MWGKRRREGRRPRTNARWAPVLAWGLAAATLGTGCGGKEAAGPVVRSVPPDTLSAWLSARRRLVLFDSRPDSLYERGHVPGSIRAHGRSIPELRDVLPFGPDVPIVVVEGDSTGDSLASRLAAYGFPVVCRLAGGVQAWREQGYQLDGYHTLPR
jgi:rhodanese-related sulfurtransferase